MAVNLFEDKHEQFIAAHMKSRKGESLRRLRTGHGFAEKLFLRNVWWPTIGHYDYLYPEYECSDFKDGSRYLDFAYIRPPFRINIEIDGYQSHAKNIDRWRFADNLIRQNHLMLDGWKVLRFAKDHIEDQPRLCQQIIQQMMGRWFAERQSQSNLTADERDILRIAARLGRPVTAKDIRSQLPLGENYTRKLLHQLTNNGILSSAGGGKERIHFYTIATKDLDVYL
ncbi:MAG: DNA-binding response regulator [Paenibacillaceae bacterium]